MACKGIVFCLELGIFSIKEKTAIRHRIEAAGGTISATLNSSTHVLIVSASEKARGGYKVSSASSLEIPIYLVDDLDHVLSNPPTPRKAASSSRSATLRTAEPSPSATPLISWDETTSSHPSDPSPSVWTSSYTEYDASLSPPFLSVPVEESDDNWLLRMDLEESKAVGPPASSSSYATHYASSSSVQQDADSEDDYVTPYDGILGFFNEDDATSFVPRPSSSKAAPSARSPVTKDTVDTQQAFFELGGLLSDYSDFFASGPSAPKASSKASSSRISAPAPAPAPVPVPVVDDSAFQDAFLSMADLFDDIAPTQIAPRSPAKSTPAPKPTLTPKEQLEAKMSALAKKLPASAMASLRSALDPKSTAPTPASVLSSSGKSKAPTSFALNKTPSAAQSERTAKYEALFAKRPEPLTITPITFSAPTFTPLAFDLKPSSSPIKPRPLRTYKLKESSPSPTPPPIVFSSLISSYDSAVSSAPGSPKSETSLLSAEEDKSQGTISDLSSEASVSPLSKDLMSNIHSEVQSEDEDGDFYSEEDYFDDAGVEEEWGFEEDISPLTQKATVVVSKPPSQPRVYTDHCTGLSWVKKVEKPQTKLILDSGDGKAKVMKLDDSDIKSPSDLPSLTPSAPSGPKPKKIFTGKINPKFSWADIVMGKASTTKRVPAMDGLKIFVGGVSFADLFLKGKPAAEQFPSYKEECLKKLKEKNQKAVKKLKKKARREALAKATADEEGKLSVPKTEAIKFKDGDRIARMKTDDEMMKEITVWDAKKVLTAVDQRKVMLASLFKRFGEVTTFLVDAEKGFVHVTYKNAQSAKTAMRSLKDFDTRVAIVRGLRESFTKAAKETFPSPSFYVRWTTCYQRKLDKKTKQASDAKQAKHDASVSSKAASAVSTATKVAIPAPSKPLLPESWNLPPVEPKLALTPFPEAI